MCAVDFRSKHDKATMCMIFPSAMDHDGRRQQTFGFDINVKKISEGTARERTNSITISGNCPNVTARAQ
jgi:hypothetical protein